MPQRHQDTKIHNLSRLFGNVLKNQQIMIIKTLILCVFVAKRIFFGWELYIIFISFFLLYSCEKEIEVDLPDSDSKIVIEGYIEQDSFPYIYITRSTPYFEQVSLATLINLVVKNAIVTVSDGQISEVLDFIEDTTQFPYYKYQGKVIKGQPGKTYYLNINAEGKTYTSYTTIPNPVKLDSINFKVDKTIDKDSLGYIWFYFIDPDTLGNYYRIYTKVYNQDRKFFHPFASVAEDKIINAKFVEFSTYRGQDPFANFENDTNNYRWYFHVGDTILFNLSSIDIHTYNFWNTIELDYAGGDNPFSAPITIKTNIEGGALGIWGGYSYDFDTVIATYRF